MTMFADWSDERLLEEVRDGFRTYADIKVKDNEEIIKHREEQIAVKMAEIKKLEWEIEVSSRDNEEWNQVIARIDALLTPVEEEPTAEPDAPIEG